MAVTVSTFDKTAGAIEVDCEHWADVALVTAEQQNLTAGQIDLSFVDELEITALNETHMDGKGPTDVLAFPTLEKHRSKQHIPEGSLLGDVIVCLSVAERQAPEHAGSFDAELTLLVSHGVLHLLGHDHAELGERETMQLAEKAVMDIFGFTHPASDSIDPDGSRMNK